MLDFGSAFLATTPRAQITHFKVGKQDYIKPKKSAPEGHNQQSKTATHRTGENTLQIFI